MFENIILLFDIIFAQSYENCINKLWIFYSINRTKKKCMQTIKKKLRNYKDQMINF